MLNEILNDKPNFVGKVPYKNHGGYLRSLMFGGFLGEAADSATTQKARGVFFLQDKTEVIRNHLGWRVPKHLVFGAGKEFSPGSFSFPVFARPCPTVPRHGFVDSIQCKNVEELNALSQETFDVEPDAEFLVTKPIDSYFNAIVTNGTITFAHGNDGATGGKNVRYFYVSDDVISKIIKLPDHILIDGEVPFYEIVISKKGQINLVQCRSAPGIPHSKDFVPHKVEVKQVIKAEGDLLDWEAKLKNVDPYTTAIDHSGGSLASHFSIHAIINKIPIFTTYSPKVGDVIEPTVESSDITPLDRQKFFEAFVIGFSSTNHIYKNTKFIDQDPYQISRNILHLSLATLHNFNAISLNKDYELLGVVLGLFIRVCLSVSKGEARYSKDRTSITSSPLWKSSGLNKFANAIPGSRTACYKALLMSDAKTNIEEIIPIYRIFNEFNWGEGYGGPKWASCTRSVINLFNSCVTGNIEKVVEQFNVVINENHNGGRYLNKVISAYAFDRVAEDPSLYTMKHMAQIFEILDFAWQNGEKNEGFKDSYKMFQPINYEEKSTVKSTYKMGKWEISKVEVVSAEHNYDTGGGSVTFKAEGKNLETEASHVANFTIQSKDSYFDTADWCCNYYFQPILKPAPHWFVAANGDKVISKRKFKSCFLGTIQNNSK